MQVTHKWSLAIACLLNTALLEALEEAGHIKTVAAATKMETASSFVASTAPRTSFGVVTTASEIGQNLFLKKTLQKAFVSVQSEKVRGGGVCMCVCVEVQSEKVRGGGVCVWRCRVRR